MKKSSKFLIILFTILNLVSIGCRVYAYTEDEAKTIINYTEVDSSDQFEYDVRIDANDMILDIKIPIIQSSIEKVLYGTDGLTDINFLNDSTTNTNSAWLTIQGVVTTFYRVCLYLATIILITTLIYMAIILVVESYKPDYMPRGARMFRDPKGGNPEKEIRKKALFDQWLVAVILIAFITVIINLVVYFTDSFANIVAGYEVADNNIIVYVDDDDDYTFETSIEGLIMFESQYNWSKHAARNALYILSGIIVTCFKYFVYLIFVIRMFIIAILVTVAPIVVIIDAYRKIARKKGIFRIWLTTFLYFALIKPIIAIVYYILGATDFMQTFPLYILFVITVEVAAIIISIMMFIRSLRNANKAEQREYDEVNGNAPATTTRARMMQPQSNNIDPYSGDDYKRIVRELRGVEAGDRSTYLNDRLGEGQDRQEFVKKLRDKGGLTKESTYKQQDIDIVEELQADESWNKAFEIFN